MTVKDIDQKYPYHTISADETLEKLSSDKEGLSSEEVKKRQDEFGKNVLPRKGGTSPFKLFFKQFKDFLVIILIIAAVIAFLADQMADVYLIAAVILFNAVMGFVQEYKAEQAIESIKDLIKRKAAVLRDGKKTELSAEECVPGDIILLEEGQSIPADARLLEVKELSTSEAALTGESMPVEKHTEPVEDENEPLGDRPCIVFKGTNVAQGKGKAVVYATGVNTELGKIAASMSSMEMQDSNFRRKTGQLGKQMAVISIVTSLIVFIIGYWFRGMEFQEIMLVTIATLVSSIPEGLPAVISIVLAIGANRMAKQNVIIREFTATEMMGSVSVILSDKTGTITQSILTVKKTFTGSGKELEVTGDGYRLEGEFKSEDKPVELEEHPVERKMLSIAAFCNNAYINENNEENE
jgi:P-type Ca2+ transporter type 2C